MSSKGIIDETLIKEYYDCISTLKECSSDDANNEYLCDSEMEVYDFDLVKEKFCKKYAMSQIKSVDSLFIKEDRIYLIEFKNQKGKS